MNQPSASPNPTAPADLAAWLAALDDVPAGIELPSDLLRPAGGAAEKRVAGHRVGAVALALDSSERGAVTASAARLDVSPALVSTAAWAALIARYLGEGELVLGRGAAADADGLAVEVDALRLAVATEQSFGAWVEHVAATDRAALARGRFSVQGLLTAMGAAPGTERHPVFQVAVVTADDAVASVRFLDDAVPCDLVLVLDAQGLPRSLQHRADRSTPEQAARIAGHLRSLLRQATADTDAPLSSFDVLAPEEHAALDAWNRTDAAYETEITIATLVQRQAAATPDAVALDDGERQVTYAELWARVTALANDLRGRGVGPDVRVAVSIERSVEMIVAMTAVLEADGAYVPIDPAYPQQRREYMVRDSAAALTLTGPDAGEPHGIRIESTGTANADPSLSLGDRLAYVIYTSGSTGQPKGVAMTQRALRNLLQWQVARPDFAPGARVLQFTSLSFDVSFQEIMSTLITGGTLLLVSDAERRDPLRFLGHVVDRGVERLYLPFVALRGLANAARTSGRIPSTLREVYTAGEQLSVDDTVRFFFDAMPGCILENQYGPSESHVVTAYRLPGAAAGWEALPPIGAAIANSKVHVLDRGRQRCGVAMTGELFLEGECLARGYLDRPELTAERFVTLDPHDGGGPRRLYTTGDLVRWRPDGVLEFLGRRDLQVKFRGFRIEPGEVSALLSNHPHVEQCVATVRDVEGAGARLIAFVRPASPSLDLADLHRFAHDNLPDHLVPSRYAVIDAFPLTPSGKIDVEAMPTPAFNRAILGSAFKEPTTAEEIRLAQLWCDLLGLQQVGIDDDFFVLGGDSLLAVELFARIREAFGRDLPLGALAQAPTIRALAAALRSADDPWPVLVPLKTTGDRTPVFCVHGGTGNVATFPVLARALPDDQPFYALQWDGLNGTRGTRTVPGMAHRYLEEVRKIQPHGPYVLAGQCVGGLVALEMAKALQDDGEEVALLALYDSPNLASPSYRPEARFQGAATVLRYPQPRRRLGNVRTNRTMDAESHGAGVRPEWRTAYASRSMVEAVTGHVPQTLDVRTLYFSSGENDAYHISLSGRWSDGVMGWSFERSEQFEIHHVPGGHNHLLYHPEAVRLLSEALDGVEAAKRAGDPAASTARVAAARPARPPMFSVLIASFCRPRELREAIASVLAQSDDDVEIVIGDDWSADGTEQVLRELLSDPRIRVARPARHGWLSSAFEAARREARGRYLVPILATDALTPDALKTYRAAIERHGTKVLACTASEYYDELWESKSPTAPKPGTLVVAGGSGREQTLRARAHLAPLYAFRALLPKHLSCWVIERALAHEVATAYGTLFHGFETDGFTVAVALDRAGRFTFIDRPLVVVRHTRNPPDEIASDGTTNEQVWRVHHGWELDVEASPLRSHTQMVALMDGLWWAQNQPAGASLLRYGRDLHGFAELQRKELVFRRSVGIDVEADFVALNEWVQTLPADPDPVSRRNRAEATAWRQSMQLRRARGYRRAENVDAAALGAASMADAARIVSERLGGVTTGASSR